MLKSGRKQLKIAARKARRAKRAVLVMKKKIIRRGKKIIRPLKAVKTVNIFSLKKIGFKKFAATAFAFGLLLQGIGLIAVKTGAYFDDTEISNANTFAAGSLGFSLSKTGFGSSQITLETSATSTVTVIDHSSLPFQYDVKGQITGGDADFCGALNLAATLDGAAQGSGPISSFTSPTNLFSTSTPTWVFGASLERDFLQDKHCDFKFIYTGWQENASSSAQGFFDTEEAAFSLAYVSPLKLKINKVYANPDSAHKDSSTSGNQWIELYNTDTAPVDISNWKLGNKTSDDTIASSSPLIIPAGGYALITDKADTLDFWQIPTSTLAIVLDDGKIGDGLANDADILALKDTKGKIIDQMNWGTPSASWNYYSTSWKPGVPAAAIGDMLARVPSGFDTDQPADFQELKPPTVAMVNPAGGEHWYVGDPYDIQWTAHSNNASSTDADLKISLWYSGDSGQTWAEFAHDIPNTGHFSWTAPLFIGTYYVPSETSRVKAVAVGPENFMVQAFGSSEDFCPPIDYDALSEADQQLVDQMVQDGLIDPSVVIKGGVHPVMPPAQDLAVPEDPAPATGGGGSSLAGADITPPEGTTAPETLATTTDKSITDSPSGVNPEILNTEDTVIPPVQQPPANDNQNPEQAIQNPPVILPNADQTPAVEPPQPEVLPDPDKTPAPEAVAPPPADAPSADASPATPAPTPTEAAPSDSGQGGSNE